jgi:hypothetical protein
MAAPEQVHMVMIVVELLTVLAVLIVVRRSHRALTQRWMNRAQAVQSELGRMRGTVLDLKRRLDETERRAEFLSPPAVSQSSLNLNRRAQAIRMLRRGAHAEQVSAALSIPVKQVELLLKVSQLAAASSDSGQTVEPQNRVH